MSRDRWAAVRCVTGLLLPADPMLDAALAANVAAGLPAHEVSPAQGRLLELTTTGVRAGHERLAAEPRVRATTIQTVGAKGSDGFTLALVTG